MLLASAPNMWHAASGPCSLLVEASDGAPITSPTAYHAGYGRLEVAKGLYSASSTTLPPAINSNETTVMR